MKAGAQELLQVLKSTTEAGATHAALAVVSPCSQCQNFLAMPDATHPMCPRRYWESRAAQADQAGMSSSQPPDYLTRKARADDATGYENPVSWEQGKTRLVWVATLDENRPLLNSDGSLKNPDILSPGFDTQYICCRHLPYVPGVREADYYAGQQLVEWNPCLITSVKLPQQDMDNPYQQSLIGGFVSKTTPLQRFNITPAQQSVNPQGI